MPSFIAAVFESCRIFEGFEEFDFARTGSLATESVSGSLAESSTRCLTPYYGICSIKKSDLIYKR